MQPILQNREECPFCHFVSVMGYHEDNKRKCPSCKKKFISGQKINHGYGCNICWNRNNGTNNIYYRDGCPALMNDGRFMKYFGSTNELTESMRKLNGIQNSNQFRKFMQDNGQLFMDAERNHHLRMNHCQPKIACSEGWYDLWTKNHGHWIN